LAFVTIDNGTDGRTENGIKFTLLKVVTSAHLVILPS
jgi:hypothetical protein